MKQEHRYLAAKITDAEYHLCTGKGPIRERFSKAYDSLAAALAVKDSPFESELEKIRDYMGDLCGTNLAGVTDDELQRAAIAVFEMSGIISDEKVREATQMNQS